MYKKTRKEFKGYYVEVPNGMDAIRAYKRIKRNQKKDRFFEELQKARDDNQFMGAKRKR